MSGGLGSTSARRAGRDEKKRGREQEWELCRAPSAPPLPPPPCPPWRPRSPPEHAPFEALVMSLLSTDNAARTAAEARLADAKAASPDALAAGALAVLRGSGDLAARAFCAVLLRKVLRSGGRGDRGGWWRGGRGVGGCQRGGALARDGWGGASGTKSAPGGSRSTPRLAFCVRAGGAMRRWVAAHCPRPTPGEEPACSPPPSPWWAVPGRPCKALRLLPSKMQPIHHRRSPLLPPRSSPATSPPSGRPCPRPPRPPSRRACWTRSRRSGSAARRAR